MAEPTLRRGAEGQDVSDLQRAGSQTRARLNAG